MCTYVIGNLSIGSLSFRLISFLATLQCLLAFSAIFQSEHVSRLAELVDLRRRYFRRAVADEQQESVEPNNTKNENLLKAHARSLIKLCV